MFDDNKLKFIKIDVCISRPPGQLDVSAVKQSDFDSKGVACSKPVVKQHRAYEVVPEGITMQGRFI